MPDSTKTKPAPSDDFCQEVRNSLREVQNQICEALENIEKQLGSTARFQEDRWERDGGGGGWTRVLDGGAWLEKGGVNVSEVHGELEADFAAQLSGKGTQFYATGVSLVLHPQNPFVPTVHANFRYIRQGDAEWFGGGADLTPYYFFQDDRDHFHQIWKEACDAHPMVANYEKFSQWCERYFYIPHRKEHRGVGGIFFDNLSVSSTDSEHRRKVWQFVNDAAHRFLSSYLPIVERRINLPFNQEQKEWQEIRRGRYAEFNLIYDRGTLFGLRTGGRIESILMSMPPRARWVYDHSPPAGSREAQLLEQLRRALPN